MTASSARDAPPAVVILAHDKARHLHRLIAALAPLPTFVHVDANTGAGLYDEMVAGLPAHVTLLPRNRAGWAQWGLLEAELTGYRVALEQTQADHIIFMTGADFPLVSADRLAKFLAAHPDRSFAEVEPLPRAEWGLGRGYDRFLLRNWAWRRRRLAAPWLRLVPRGLRLSGGSQVKILTRRHAGIVVDVLDHRPDLVKFFKGCWIPDEVVIPTLLLSEGFEARWAKEGTSLPHLWYIDWGPRGTKSPRWLDMSDMPAIRAAAERPDLPALFARKFSDDSADLVNAIDLQLRARASSSDRL